MEYKDQLNRIISLPSTPVRIVSLVPSQTELLVDLGLRESLVGITKFCVHPSQLKKANTVVGGTKQVHLKKIAALEPDIIICNKEENTEEMVLALEKIAPVWVSDMETIPDAVQMIEALGAIFKVEEKASQIIAKITTAQQDFLEFIKEKPARKVAYLIWKKPYMAAGKNTFINSLLELNHFKNIFAASDKRYPEIEVATLQEADVILLSSEPFPFKEKHCKELTALLGKEVCLVDGEYFSWYGSRLIKAFAYFKTLH